MAKQTIGEFLSVLRKERGYTQQEVAEKLNVSNKTLSSWETDRTAPDLSMLPLIAELYGITVDELLRGEKTQSVQVAPQEIEQQKDPLKEQYNIFNRKLNLLTLFGILCSLIVFTGFVTLLYSTAPLWIDAVLVIAGLIVNAVLIVLMFKYENSALQNADGDNSFSLTLRHKLALSIIFNALAYLIVTIIHALCYCFAPLNYVDILDRVYEFYDTYAAVAISICAIPTIALFFAGILNDVLYTNCLGNTEQKSNLKCNTKLLKKISLFGIIPIAVSLIPFIAFSHVTVQEVDTTYFTANGIDEVYTNFQTLTFEYDTNYTDDEITIPKGEYFLNFQSETYITCGYTIALSYFNIYDFYDLGNNFYATYSKDYYNNEYASVYYLKNGVSVDDLNYETDCSMYFKHIRNLNKVFFQSPNGEKLSAFSFIYDSDYVYHGEYYNLSDELVMTRDGDVYTYQLIDYYDYSPLAFYIFIGAITATVLTCFSIHLVKRKKQYYNF